jgi:hypothetical protein
LTRNKKLVAEFLADQQAKVGPIAVKISGTAQ